MRVEAQRAAPQNDVLHNQITINKNEWAYCVIYCFILSRWDGGAARCASTRIYQTQRGIKYPM